MNDLSAGLWCIWFLSITVIFEPHFKSGCWNATQLNHFFLFLDRILIYHCVLISLRSSKRNRHVRNIIVFSIKNSILIIGQYFILWFLFKKKTWKFYFQNCWTEKAGLALAGLLSGLKHHPIHRRVVSLIPSHSTYLGWGFDPWLRCNRRQLIDVSLSHWCCHLFFSLSLPSLSKKIKRHISEWEF